MKFFKDNSYDIVKILVNQIGITIFSLMLYFTVNAIGDDKLSSQLSIAVSVFSTIFFYALLYTSMWDIGAKDIIRIDGGKLEAVKGKGALLALFANIPNYVLAGLAVLFMGIHMISGSDGAYTAFVIFNLLVRFTDAVYLGLLNGIFSFLETNQNLYYFWQSVGYFVLPTLTILVTQLGYVAGMRNFRIFGAFTAKSKKK